MEPHTTQRFSEFFDLKEEFRSVLEGVEKDIFLQTQKMEEMRGLLDRMSEIAVEENSEYFQVRIRYLHKKLKTFLERRSYEKIEFDSIFKEVDKLKDSDGIEFLSKALKNRLENIVSGNLVQASPKNQRDPNKVNLIPFSYNGVHFLTENGPKAFMYNVDARPDKIKIGEKHYHLFPGRGFGLADFEPQRDLSEYCNVMILQKKGTYECFRFHELGETFQMNRSSLESGKRKVNFQHTKIEYSFRKGGTRYYLI